MIEMLDPSQPWDIPLPTSWEDPERLLEARYGETVTEQWVHADGSWSRVAGRWKVTHTFAQIISICMAHGWTLHSLPAVPGGTENETETEETD